MKAAQIRAARALIGITQAELAKAANLSVPSIKRIEAMSGPLTIRLETLRALKEALETAGVEFIPENGGGAGVRLKKYE